MALRQVVVMPRLVNGSYSSEAAEKGDTIDIPKSVAVTTSAVAPSNTPPAGSDTTPTKVQIALDNWQQNDAFYLTDKELTEVDRNKHFVPMQVSEAVKALASDVNNDIMQEYKGVYAAVGTAGTTPFASDATSIISARGALHKMLAPRNDRRFVLDVDAEANALALATFSDFEKTGDAAVKIEGEMGRKYGFDWFYEDDVLTHTAGTIDNGSGAATCLVNVALAAGATTMNVDGSTLTGTVVQGDLFSFAGLTDNGVSGTAHFVVTNTSAVTAAGDAMTGITFAPALPSIIADNTVVTFEASHVVNMAFHRDAIGFATRPLVSNTLDVALGSEIMSMQDPQTGLVLRLEVSRQHKRTAWEFDILWGAKLIRPELVCRVLG
jgi:hypothetical protein